VTCTDARTTLWGLLHAFCVVRALRDYSNKTCFKLKLSTLRCRFVVNMFQFLFCLNMFETCLCLLHIGSCLQRLYFISIEFWLQWWVGGFNSFVELLVAMRRAQWISGQPVQKGQKAVTSSQCRCTTWYWTGFAFLAGFTCGAFTLIIVIFFYLLLSD
jgi:hypothetical protein